MVSLAPDSCYSAILSDPQIDSIWSDKSRIEIYLHFESALARVQSKLNIIPREAADAIAAACENAEQFIDYKELKRQTEVIGYPVLPLVKQLVQYVNDSRPGQNLGEWAHWGATTQDLTDTATSLQIKETLTVTEQLLDTIIKTLQQICEKHKATPMPARSNLQQAVPITVGFKFARLLSTFLRHKQRLSELRSRVLVLQFSGAAGTLATLSPDGTDPIGLECQRHLAAELNLTQPDMTWHTERDNIAEYGFWFCNLTQTCGKLALDLKLEMQTEVAEMKEGFIPHRGSSSTMPQKRNPIACVYITALAATVRGLSATLCESMLSDHERSTGPWEIEWIVLPQISTQSVACLKHTRDVLRSLEIYPAAMQRNLALSQGLIVSEAVMMGLGPKLGRQKAHDLVYELCQRASENNKPLVELLLADPEVQKSEVTEEELRHWCNPANYLGLSVPMTERVLEIASRASK